MAGVKAGMLALPGCRLILYDPPSYVSSGSGEKCLRTAMLRLLCFTLWSGHPGQQDATRRPVKLAFHGADTDTDTDSDTDSDTNFLARKSRVSDVRMYRRVGRVGVCVSVSVVVVVCVGVGVGVVECPLYEPTRLDKIVGPTRWIVHLGPVRRAVKKRIALCGPKLDVHKFVSCSEPSASAFALSRSLRFNVPLDTK